MLRTPQLKPFIVFIKPPAFEFLKETRSSAHARSTFDENNSRGFTVSKIRMYKFDFFVFKVRTDKVVGFLVQANSFIDHGWHFL